MLACFAGVGSLFYGILKLRGVKTIEIEHLLCERVGSDRLVSVKKHGLEINVGSCFNGLDVSRVVDIECVVD